MWLVDNDGVIKFVHVTRVTLGRCFYYGMNSAGINGRSPPASFRTARRATACSGLYKGSRDPVKPKTYREDFLCPSTSLKNTRA